MNGFKNVTNDPRSYSFLQTIVTLIERNLNDVNTIRAYKSSKQLNEINMKNREKKEFDFPHSKVITQSHSNSIHPAWRYGTLGNT